MGAPADLIRIRAYVVHIAKQQSVAWPGPDAGYPGGPGLVEFQTALLSDPDLELAFVAEDEMLAKQSMAAIIYRLWPTRPPHSILKSMRLIGVKIR